MSDEWDGEWQPGRWWRVCDANGRLMMETSDAEEAREYALSTGLTLERIWVRKEQEFRPWGMSAKVERDAC